MSVLPADYAPGMIDKMVPNHLRDGLRRYIEDGVRPGSGIQAVLSNDMLRAVCALDDTALAGLRDFAKFLHNYAPSDCWGSVQKIDAWISHQGLMGRER